jgi:hypothetical protein
MSLLLSALQPYLPVAQLAISFVAFGVALWGGILGFRSFQRTERWKKAEFLAEKMKDFFDDDRVQKTKLLIDWEFRTIPLHPTTETYKGTGVTRLIQAKALRPHSIDPNIFGPNEQVKTDPEGYFTDDDVAIRDCYERFLDGLETLANYAETELVEKDKLEPYIGYWLKKIQDTSGSKDDAAWRAALLTFIHFYGYHEVPRLFKAFRFDIGVKGDTYRKLLTMMEDKRFADALVESLESVVLPDEIPYVRRLRRDIADSSIVP